MGVGLLTSARFVEHETGPRHPERPERLRAILTGLHQAGLLAEPLVEAPAGLDLSVGGPVGWSSTPMTLLPFAPAGDDTLGLCHPAAHIEMVRRACGRLAEGEMGVLDAGDTPVCRRSEEIACLAVGAGVAAVDAVLRGEVGRALVVARPPGHHAEPERSQGFCLYSNIAIAARHAMKRHGLTRVAIVDFDVHHGNGTQACFETDPDVLFVSLHQHPTTCYPGTGFEWETGTGPAKGTKLNVPLAPKSGDRVYLRAMTEQVIPRLESFGPELLLISAGFDAHMDDPLADMSVTEEGFAEMTKLLVDASGRLCGGKVVSMVEGGYHLPALARSVVRHAIALQG